QLRFAEPYRLARDHVDPQRPAALRRLDGCLHHGLVPAERARRLAGALLDLWQAAAQARQGGVTGLLADAQMAADVGAQRRVGTLDVDARCLGQRLRSQRYTEDTGGRQEAPRRAAVAEAWRDRPGKEALSQEIHWTEH